MITEKWTRAQVEDAMAHYWEHGYFGGNEGPDFVAFAENFFEYGYQNKSNASRSGMIQDILDGLEDYACTGVVHEEKGGKTLAVVDAEDCAVLGKAILRTFTRRQVVTDALSFLSRAADDGVWEAALELCNWYAARILSNDLANFEIADVGLSDLYCDESYPRQTFPKDIGECRRRLVGWLRKTKDGDVDFQRVKYAFSALAESSLDVPANWQDASVFLESFTGGATSEARLAEAKAMIENASGDDAAKRIAQGAKIVRELAEKADLPEAWRYMLKCHEKGIGPFKTNKFRRDAKAALARLEKATPPNPATRHVVAVDDQQYVTNLPAKEAKGLLAAYRRWKAK